MPSAVSAYLSLHLGVFPDSDCMLQVNSILRHVAELLEYQTNEELEALYEKTAWYFDDKYGKPGAAFEAFKTAVM